MSRRFSGRKKVGKKPALKKLTSIHFHELPGARKDYEDEDSEEWDIDAILDTRGEGKDLEYLIKWKGRDQDGKPWENSWEPVENVSQEAIKAFEKSQHSEDDADERKERSPPSDRLNESTSPEKSDTETMDAASQPLRKRKTKKKTKSNGNATSNGSPKRKARAKVYVASSSDEDEEPEKEKRDILVIDSSNSPSVEAPTKAKKPARKSPVSVVGPPKKSDSSNGDDRPKKKRGRGRPPKQSKAKRTAPKESVSASVESMEIDDDDDDNDKNDETYEPSEESVVSIASDDDEESAPPRKRRKKAVVEIDDGNVEYEVEKILRSKKGKEGTEYLVKWKGCDDDENSWVTEDDLSCPQLLKEFEKSKKRKRKLENKSMPPAKKAKTSTRAKQKPSDEWLAWGRSTSASACEIVEQMVSVLSEQELKKISDSYQVGWGLD